MLDCPEGLGLQRIFLQHRSRHVSISVLIPQAWRLSFWRTDPSILNIITPVSAIWFPLDGWGRATALAYSRFAAMNIRRKGKTVVPSGCFGYALSVRSV